jgi:Tfp pilus assembly protein PilP
MCLVVLGCAAVTSPAALAAPAQAPAAPPPPQAQAPAPPAKDTAPAPPADFSYAIEARRDPFVSLINRGTETKPSQSKVARPEGIAGVLVDEVAVRGIVQTRGAWVAMIAAPNGRTYTVRPGDRLMDGNVHTITGESVVLTQEVKDPLSLAKRREVSKPLRGEVK